MKAFFTTMVIKYPNGATQVVRPNMEYFKGDWDGLAKSIAGEWFKDRSGNITNVPYELK
jgi:hypothetical protein